MKIVAITLASFAILCGGCATTDMRAPTVAKSDGALVKSRSVSTEHYQTTLKFLIIDGRPVDPGFWRSPAKMEVTISEGSHAITFDLIRRAGMFAPLVGASGVLKFEAKKDRTYVLNSEEHEGIVLVWVEDEATKQRVSDPTRVPLTSRAVNQGMVPIFIPVR